MIRFLLKAMIQYKQNGRDASRSKISKTSIHFSKPQMR